MESFWIIYDFSWNYPLSPFSFPHYTRKMENWYVWTLNTRTRWLKFYWNIHTGKVITYPLADVKQPRNANENIYHLDSYDHDKLRNDLSIYPFSKSFVFNETPSSSFKYGDSSKKKSNQNSHNTWIFDNWGIPEPKC